MPLFTDEQTTHFLTVLNNDQVPAEDAVAGKKDAKAGDDHTEKATGNEGE